MIQPKLPAVAAVATLALLVSGQRAGAQSASELETRFEAGAQTTRTAGLPVTALSFAPAIRYANNRFSVRASGAAWLGERSWQLGDASLGAETYRPLSRNLRAEFSMGADRTVFDETTANDQFDAGARLHWRTDKGGVFLGSGVSRPLRVPATSTINVSSGGAWTKFRNTTVRGTVTSFYFTKAIDTNAVEVSPQVKRQCAAVPPVKEPLQIEETEYPISFSNVTAGPGATCAYSSRLTDLEGVVQWMHRSVELTFRGGYRFGPLVDIAPESQRWGSVQVAYWLTSQIAAVAGTGREPSQPSRGLPARNFASLGLMLAYWPIPRQTVLVESPATLVRAFELRPAGVALQRLTARIGGVETVEIMGDFTDWAPLPLTRRGRDHWELLIPMSPGVHQINLRIDGGEWIAPPGIPSIKDGFSGEVGILVIRN